MNRNTGRYTVPFVKGIPVLERLEQRTTKTDTCWIYQGRPKANGYAKLYDSGKYLSVHRIAYENSKGHIPEGLEIDHTCCVKLCVNPDHLEIVTSQENNRRKGERNLSCGRGHPKSPENSYYPPSKKVSDNRWVCKTCRKLSDRRYKQRKKMDKANRLLQ